MRWLTDGTTVWEERAADALRTISSIDQSAAAALLSLPWVVDDMDATKEIAISSIKDIVVSDLELAHIVLSQWWLADGMPMPQATAVGDIHDLNRHNPDLARQMITQPFMEPPFRDRDQYALYRLATMAKQDAPMLVELIGQPWFTDGIDDLDAALIHAIYGNHDFMRALMVTHHTRTLTVDLPHKGEVDIVVVRHTPFPDDDHTLALIAEGALHTESLMGLAWPSTDIIVLVTENDIWETRNPGLVQIDYYSPDPDYSLPYSYYTHRMILQNTDYGLSRYVLYHEVSHYYYVRANFWLVEGLADFFASYTFSQLGERPLTERLAQLRCLAQDVQHHVGPAADYYCLGERFLLAMYFAMGQEALSAVLRDLYIHSQSDILDEDVIYQTFLSHAPSGKEEAVRSAYREHHGDVTPPTLGDSPDRPVLAAFYEATGGSNWRRNDNWFDHMALGAWYGVETSLSQGVYLIKLGRNLLSGHIPAELAGLANLLWLELWENDLSGPIPPELGNLQDLVSLSLQYNQLTGAIPSELGRLSKLERLRLHRNQLSGRIPPELGNLTSLTWLDLSLNRLSGEIPPQLGDLPNIELLRFDSNELSGEIPHELGNLSTLRDLELQFNQLTGEIPIVLTKLPLLRDIRVTGNQMTGDIPPELGNLSGLRVLYLAYNQFTGEIPQELTALSELFWLDLSYNQLSGEIPQGLTALPLEELWLAGNNFTGCIPDGLRDVPTNDLHLLDLPYCGDSR